MGCVMHLGVEAKSAERIRGALLPGESGNISVLCRLGTSGKAKAHVY